MPFSIDATKLVTAAMTDNDCLTLDYVGISSEFFFASGRHKQLVFSLTVDVKYFCVDFFLLYYNQAQ